MDPIINQNQNSIPSTPNAMPKPNSAAIPGATANSTPAPLSGADNLIYRTMPRGYAPTTQTTPQPNPTLPGAPSFAGHIGASGLAGPKKSDAIVKYVLIALAVAFVAAAAYFGYKFFAGRSTTPAPAATQAPTTPTDTTNPPTQTTTPAPAQSQIPSSWQQKFFGAAICANQDVCGDAADPDHDGLTNADEFKAGTDPNNPDTDADGIADGDEAHVFNLDPNNGKTSGVTNFTDSGDLNFKYNSHTHTAFTDTDLQQIAANIKTYGLHSPTTKTLSADIINFYTNYTSTAAQNSTAPQAGALDRDTQRSYTIKQIAYALLSYYQTNQGYPVTTDFTQMIAAIKPLLAGKAVNAMDPTNVAPYVYSYQPVNGGADFQIGYYSETQHQQIILRAADAQKDLAQDQADQRDIKRTNDLQQIAGALNLYSTDHANPSSPTQLVFPPQATWKQALSTKYLAIIPVDPKTNQDYVYTVSANNASFALTATLEDPPTAKKTYVCTQDGCDYN